MRVPRAAVVVSVNRSAKHTTSKTPVDAIVLRSGHGVEGDAHFGATVQHRYDRRRYPQRANARQVHLIAAELFDELAVAGCAPGAGLLGENLTTRGIDLTALPAGTRLHVGAAAIVELSGLRRPCVLIDRVQPGLRAATTMLRRGAAALRHGVMAIVIADGEVRAGDGIRIVLPAEPHRELSLV